MISIWLPNAQEGEMDGSATLGIPIDVVGFMKVPPCDERIDKVFFSCPSFLIDLDGLALLHLHAAYATRRALRAVSNQITSYHELVLHCESRSS